MSVAFCSVCYKIISLQNITETAETSSLAIVLGCILVPQLNNDVHEYVDLASAI